MDQQTSVTYATARAFTDWTDAGPAEQAAALLRASDYIATTYQLTAILSDDEQVRYDAAQFLIARDLLTNATALPVRASAPVTKDSKELAGLKKLTEYGDAPTDLYPQATALLAPLCVSSASSFYLGRLTR